MKYDFDKRIDRRDNATYKWDQSERLFGRKDILPLWVADMDFEPPREVRDAIVARAEAGIYGYTIRTQAYSDAIIGWMERRHGWAVKPEWLTSATPGVVPQLSVVVQEFTKPGDGVILQSPVYYPFYDVIKMNGRTVVDNPLVLRDGRFVMDFELLERQAKEAKLLLLCTPHNPGGRVWTREELERVADIARRNDLIVVADEIHHDLVYAGHKHIPFASLSEDAAQRSITCFAPSKTFNLAGLQVAGTIIPNAGIRSRYNAAVKTLSIHMESYFGVTAMESSYRHGDEWLDQLLVYLEGNRDALLDFFATRLPQVKVMRPEGTYMAWLDCRAISGDPQELKRIMFEQAGVAFSEGSVFGQAGKGHLRVNFACPRSLLLQALEQFADAVDAYVAR